MSHDPAPNQIPADPTLIDLLRGAHRERARLRAGVRAALGLALWGTVLVPLFAADALWILPPTLRFALLCLWLAFPFAILFVALRTRRHPFSETNAALAEEKRGGLQNDEVASAVDLLHGARPGISESLRKESVARGVRALQQVQAEYPLDRRPLRRARLARVAVVCGVVLLGALFPGVVRQVTPRFLQPWGDHPPYTRLRFRVEQTPDPVPLRHDARLRVHVEGPGLPDRAELLFHDEGDAPVRVRMQMANVGDEENGVSFASRLDNISGPRVFSIDTPRGRSRRFELAVSTRPRLEGAWLRVEPPAYTGWPAREERITAPQLEALRGSRVTLMLDANLPLGDSRLEWDHPDRHEQNTHVPMPPLPKPDTRAAGHWTAAVDDHFRAWLFGANGEKADVPFSGSFTVRPDRPPRVAVTDPEKVVYAPEDWTVNLSLTAVDDVRVERMDVSVLRGDSVSVHPIELDANRSDPTRAQAVHALDLAAIGARAGDRIRYFATAVDNHPEPPQSADSEIGVIQVLSREAYDAMMREHYRIEDWLEEVADHLATLNRLRDEKAALLDQLEELHDRAAANPDEDLSREIAAARSRLERLREDFDAFAGALTERAELDQLHDWETPYKEWLKETAAQMQEQQNAAGEVARALAAPAASALSEAMTRWAEMTEPFGDLPSDPMDLEQEWDEMVDAMRMVDQTMRLRQLIEDQQDIADRLASARDRPDSPETREILRRLSGAQELLRQELQEVQQGLREAADALEESQPDLAREGRALADALDRMNVAGDQADAAGHAEASRAEPASQSAQRAADSLASLAGDCEAQCEAAGQCLSSLLGLTPPGLHPSMEAAMQAALTARPGFSPGRTGTQGPGSGGLISTVGMVGPQYPSRGQSVALRSASRRRGDGLAGGQGHGASPAPAEALHPDALPESFHTAPGLGTIPLRYRRQAAAYFDRLIQDDSNSEP
ncbi:MAG: hypothetical protein JJU29_10620 [Verrucomicrobia bacterium]|nr:hypothetical protein [Verrucomicrobiota bacterium]MCH8513268.1 hypothetical protein [Kiritimatiellia bacterium]